MYSLVIGGFLPGTNTQLSFQAWLIAMNIVVLIGMVIRLEFKRVATSEKEKTTFIRNYAPNARELHSNLGV